MVLSRAAAVLDEEKNFDLQMRWILFQQEISFDWSDGGWVPGIPLRRDPRMIDGPFFAPNSDDTDRLSRGDSHHVRPMMEIFDDQGNSTASRMRCSDCLVSWAGTDPDCWICGIEPTGPGYGYMVGRSGYSYIWSPDDVPCTEENPRRQMVLYSPGYEPAGSWYGETFSRDVIVNFNVDVADWVSNRMRVLLDEELTRALFTGSSFSMYGHQEGASAGTHDSDSMYDFRSGHFCDDSCYGRAIHNSLGWLDEWNPTVAPFEIAEITVPLGMVTRSAAMPGCRVRTNDIVIPEEIPTEVTVPLPSPRRISGRHRLGARGSVVDVPRYPGMEPVTTRRRGD